MPTSSLSSAASVAAASTCSPPASPSAFRRTRQARCARHCACLAASQPSGKRQPSTYGSSGLQPLHLGLAGATTATREPSLASAPGPSSAAACSVAAASRPSSSTAVLERVAASANLGLFRLPVAGTGVARGAGYFSCSMRRATSWMSGLHRVIGTQPAPQASPDLMSTPAHST